MQSNQHGCRMVGDDHLGVNQLVMRSLYGVEPWPMQWIDFDQLCDDGRRIYPQRQGRDGWSDQCSRFRRELLEERWWKFIWSQLNIIRHSRWERIQGRFVWLVLPHFRNSDVLKCISRPWQVTSHIANQRKFWSFGPPSGLWIWPGIYPPVVQSSPTICLMISCLPPIETTISAIAKKMSKHSVIETPLRQGNTSICFKKLLKDFFLKRKHSITQRSFWILGYRMIFIRW